MLELFLGKIEFIQPLIATLGIFSYLLVMLLASLESVPVFGTFTPGTLMLLMVGLIASQGQISLALVVIFATIGGVIGDSAGYYLGKYGSRFIKDNEGILKTSHLEQGQVFFNKHGGKSVFIGRFVGPLRPIIPLIAGMIKMNFKRYIVLNVTSAFLWAFLYVNLGYYFGHQIKFIDSVISRVGLIASLVVVTGVVYVFYRHRKKSLGI